MMTDTNTQIVVVGQGYVGLPLAIRASEFGYQVTGLDLNDETVRDLNSGISHIGDVSGNDLQRAIKGGYRATTDPAAIRLADVVVVCVPTPLGKDGAPDLGPVIASAGTVGNHVRRGALVILESTTYPGTTEELFAPLVTQGRLEIGTDIFIAFSPERIDPGNESFGVHNTPKVVGGVTDACAQRAKSFYEGMVGQVVLAKGPREAEMSKLLENTFRHVNIAMVNEMLRFCDDLDIDLWDAINCAATKPFGFMPFRPGPGVGGHCIPVDPSYLSHRVRARLGYAFRMVELAAEINDAAPGYVATRAWRTLNDMKRPMNGSKILLVGVTYKPDVADVRESPAIPLATQLGAWGAEISYWDPFVSHWPLDPTDDLGSVPIRHVHLEAAASEADLVILLQPHLTLDLRALATHSEFVLDTRGVLPAAPNVIRL